MRHSVLARLPAAPLGQRSELPAAITGAADARRAITEQAAATAARPRVALNKDGAHKQTVGIAQNRGVPGPGAGDEGQRGELAWGEQRGYPGARRDDATASHLEGQASAIP